MRTVVLTLLLAGCGGETTDDTPRCDGIKQPGEKTVDAGFDKDGDGYFAGEGCAREYDDVDCDDDNADVNPGLEEVACNDLDDDCSEATVDEPDQDFDGSSICDDTPDCDDTDFERSPTFDEICYDEIDNNCNDDVDEDCPPIYSGKWIVTPKIDDPCLFGQLRVDVEHFLVIDDNPKIEFDSETKAPGRMKGDLIDDEDVQVRRELFGDCNEIYELSGTFTSESTFEGTFTSTFQGICLNCEDGSWEITATLE